MLRSGVGLLTRLALNTETKSVQNAFALEFVRYRRKPRWLPMAKSKKNRVIERVVQDPDERAELLRLNNNYRLQMRSLMQYFREEAKRVKETSTADHIVLSPEQEEAEFQKCMSENDEWNKVIAAERAERLAKERQEREAYIDERLELAMVREEERMEEIEALVRREKENSKTFITREKLDEAINAALANPVDYNFSIDLQGNLYNGRNTLPRGSGGSSGKNNAAAEDVEQMEAQN